MAQAGFTPIQLFFSNTATNVPAALANGELAINQADGKLYYRNNAGAVTLFAQSSVSTISFGSTGLTPNTATSGAVTVAGILIAANGGTGIGSYLQGEMLFANTTTTLDKVVANTTVTKKFLSQTGNGTVGLAPSFAQPAATDITGLAASATTDTTDASNITSGLLAVARGGTGTATPSIVAGTNITVSGSWPNQTINALGVGTGDVVGPSSATDTAITLFDGTTGKLIKNSLVTVSATGAIVAPQVGSVIPFYFANQAAFPSAATYHGAIAHSHADGAMYFAHSSAWVRLLDAGTAVTVAQGGTGQTTASAAFNALSPITTVGDLILGSGVNTATRLPIGLNTYVLTSNGTTATWAAPSGGGVSTISFGSTGLTPSSATSGAITVAGTLAIANGGTGQTTANAAFNALAPAQTANRLLKSDGTNTSFAQAVLTTDVTGTLPVANGGTGVTVSTGTGSTVLNNTPSLTNPTVTNYTETVYSATGSSFNIDLTNGTFQALTINANATITLPASVIGKSYLLRLTYTGTYTVSFAGGTNLKFPGGVTPTTTNTNAKFDILAFFCDGTNTYGQSVGLNY